jgi:hypothetical protein
MVNPDYAGWCKCIHLQCTKKQQQIWKELALCKILMYKKKHKTWVAHTVSFWFTGFGNFCLFLMLLHFCTDVLTISFSLPISGPFMAIVIRLIIMSCFRRLRNRVFKRFTVLAPLSGHAFDTGMLWHIIFYNGRKKWPLYQKNMILNLQ